MMLRAAILPLLALLAGCQQPVMCEPCFGPVWVSPVLPAAVSDGALLEICIHDLPCLRERVDADSVNRDGTYPSVLFDLPNDVRAGDTDDWPVRVRLTSDTEVSTASAELSFVDKDGVCACDTSSATVQLRP
ncbi:MAG TPA: hypothetical protein VJ819_14415 [Nocardioidaceae bacterium]|nr:hypothetical protein [Nocardioidaceae bacterium]